MFDALVVHLEQPNTSKYMKTPLYMGVELWNGLPEEIRNLEDIKKNQKSY